MPGAATKGSTLPSHSSGTNGREKVLRALSLGLIAILVISSLAGLLGVRSATAAISASGYRVEVTYAATTRPGLATPFDILVATTDGSPLPDPIVIRVGGHYLAMFDENGLDPEPSSSYQNEDWVRWAFANPDRLDQLQVSLDARLEPAVQWGRDGSVALFEGSQEVIELTFRTWVIP